MNCSELIASRRSVRKYLDKEVPNGLVERLLQAAHWAPSGGNMQPWHFYVLRGEAKQKVCDSLRRPTHWIYSAPVVILVCAEPERSEAQYGERGKNLYCLQDTAAAIQNILICAKANGLSTCWVGAFDETACKEALNLPNECRPVAMISVGYSEEEPKAPERRPLTEVVTFLD